MLSADPGRLYLALPGALKKPTEKMPPTKTSRQTKQSYCRRPSHGFILGIEGVEVDQCPVPSIAAFVASAGFHLHSPGGPKVYLFEDPAFFDHKGRTLPVLLALSY